MYLNVIELAASFGVAESVVEGWVRDEGLPCVPERGRMLFDRAQVVAWAAQQGRVARTGFLAAEGPRANPGRRLEALLRTGGIWRSVAASDILGVLGQVVSRLPGATPAIRQLLAQRLGAPQGINWAPVGGGLALPHLRSPVALGPQSGILALLLLREPWGLTEPVPDEVPVTRLLFFIAPTPRAHLELLGQLSGALTRGGLRPLVLAGAPEEEIFTALNDLEEGKGKETMP